MPRSELAMVLAKLSDELPAKKVAAEIAGYLLSENRTGELDSLTRDLVNLRAEQGIVEVTVISARELTASGLEEVKSKVKQFYPHARQIIINQRVDASQVGGVRLELPGKQLDLSIKGKLNKLKQLTASN